MQPSMKSNCTPSPPSRESRASENVGGYAHGATPNFLLRGGLEAGAFALDGAGTWGMFTGFRLPADLRASLAGSLYAVLQSAHIWSSELVRSLIRARFLLSSFLRLACHSAPCLDNRTLSLSRRFLHCSLTLGTIHGGLSAIGLFSSPFVKFVNLANGPTVSCRRPWVNAALPVHALSACLPCIFSFFLFFWYPCGLCDSSGLSLFQYYVIRCSGADDLYLPCV
ncbi:hypothetical protein MVEN_00872400 [Mycena venus]|uniref:Uncharacterized protein n=1 Tax=Mycena venus TaxID=2733690 RepID=A0A8H6YH74_9AGAR|nr:hypothetical protein MVEN_00872400 [Mycena venus]